MRNIIEIFRLHFEQRKSPREIARATGRGRTTVQEYSARAAQAGLTEWEQIVSLSEPELEARLGFKKNSYFGANVPLRKSEQVMPDWSVTHAELNRSRYVTLSLLWTEYREIHGGNAYGYTQFFIACLGASSYTYAEATLTQSLPDWLASHTRMTEFFGGVCEIWVPDNLKLGVTKANRYEPLVKFTCSIPQNTMVSLTVLMSVSTESLRRLSMIFKRIRISLNSLLKSRSSQMNTITKCQWTHSVGRRLVILFQGMMTRSHPLVPKSSPLMKKTGNSE